MPTVLTVFHRSENGRHATTHRHFQDSKPFEDVIVDALSCCKSLVDAGHEVIAAELYRHSTRGTRQRIFQPNTVIDEMQIVVLPEETTAAVKDELLLLEALRVVSSLDIGGWILSDAANSDAMRKRVKTLHERLHKRVLSF